VFFKHFHFIAHKSLYIQSELVDKMKTKNETAEKTKKAKANTKKSNEMENYNEIENALNTTSTVLEEEDLMLYNSFSLAENGNLDFTQLLKSLESMGIKRNDPRLKLDAFFENETEEESNWTLSFEQFRKFLINTQGDLIRDALKGNLVIPDFKDFIKELKRIYDITKHDTSGQVATYIPQLGRVNPEHYAVSVCTVDGQRHGIGEIDKYFCIQSICKPINYCLALEEWGEEIVHKHVGREPSGIGFNGLVLNSKGLPHNPMINYGAIMSCSLLKPNEEMADRFEYVLNTWTKLSGGIPANFNNSVYLSERLTADRNFALGYFIKENGAFPDGTDLLQTLEFYFQSCSVEVNADAMAIAASTLANGGVCPLTGKRVFSSDTVKDCLSLMSSCGMYDFSGEFAFTIGLPAKSGVAGGLMVVVPNLFGLCIWSPRLDDLGNTVRGIEFCKELVKTFNFHLYDSLTAGTHSKKDPRLQKNASKIDNIISLCWAASQGDLQEVKHLYAKGVDINGSDYDLRTPLHLAASEGHENVVKYLLKRNVFAYPIDRWGNSPLDDAKRHHHENVVKMLNDYKSN